MKTAIVIAAALVGGFFVTKLAFEFLAFTAKSFNNNNRE